MVDIIRLTEFAEKSAGKAIYAQKEFVMCDCCGSDSNGSEKSLEEKVKEVIDSVRPALQGHGGDIELISVGEDNSVMVRAAGGLLRLSRRNNDT